VIIRNAARVNVHQAIRASNCGLASRVNRRTHREEFAQKTVNGIRIVKGYTDPTVVRAISPEQELAHEWHAVDAINDVSTREAV
jgi:hypothetical protein